MCPGRRAIHQHREARNGLLAAAIGVTVLHVVVAGIAAVLFTRARPTRWPSM
ncbi:MAG: hypothetical protein ABR520_04700 [Mycobacteriales bacterium]